MNSLVQYNPTHLWQALPGLRSNRRTTTLGIDLGQVETKIVCLSRRFDGSFEAEASRLATFSNNQHLVPGLESTADLQSPLNRREGSNPFKALALANTKASQNWDRQQIAEAIARISRVLSDSDLRRSPAYVNLSMAVCDLRGICQAQEADRSLARLEKLLNDATGEAVPRTIAVLPHEQDSHNKIRVFSTHERTASTIAKEMEKHRLNLRQIDGLPWCQCRTAELISSGSQANEVQLVLDWSFGSPTLTLTQNQKIKYVRRLNSGGIKNLVSQPMKDHGMSFQEASRWLTHCLAHQGEHNATLDETRQWVSECCKRLAADIEAARAFAAWRFKESPLKRLIVIGGGSAIPGLMDVLTRQSSVPCAPWKLQTANSLLGGEFATATSLAMLGVGHG